MTAFHAILAAVAAQRGAELLLAAGNTRWLKARGAFEIDGEGYRSLVLLHASWLAALAVLVPPEAAPSLPLLAAFGGLQLARVWVIACLGRRWTTRILILPGAPLVRAGPYRFCRHPNYLIVIGEIALLPAAFGATVLCVLFSLANLGVLARRIAREECALQYFCPDSVT